MEGEYSGAGRRLIVLCFSPFQSPPNSSPVHDIGGVFFFAPKLSSTSLSPGGFLSAFHYNCLTKTVVFKRPGFF